MIAVEGTSAQTTAGSKPIAAWFCAYTPIEVLAAAGLEPVRLFGKPGNSESADSILGTNICPYVRACLEQGLAGEAPGVVVFAGCCDSMRRLYDAWSFYCHPEFAYAMDVPRSTSDTSLQLYRAAIADLVLSLERFTGTEIGSDALASAIFHRSSADATLARFLPTDDRGLSMGSEEYLGLFTDAQTAPPEDFTRRWDVRSREDQAGGPGGSRKAVIVTGNLIRPGKLLGVIDECGGTVASLDLCSAERFLTWDEAALERIRDMSRDSLLDELSRRYLMRTPCPRMLNRAERYDRLTADAARRGARGVVIVPLMFCDPFLYDLPSLENHLDAAGIPSLVLQSDYQDENVGQLTTRIEAFMEMI